MPKSLEELHIYDQMGGFKRREAVGMEKALRFTDEFSDMPVIKRKVLRDLATTGIATTMDTVDDTLGLARYGYVDFTNCLLEYSSEQDFKDSRFCGYQKNMTISELRPLCNLSEDELQSLAGKWAGGAHGNPTRSSWGDVNIDIAGDYRSFGYDDYKIPVMWYVWKGLSSKTKEVEVRGKKGIKRQVEKGTISERNGKYYKKIKDESFTVQTLYQCYWIMDSDKVFKTGKLNDIPFDYYNKEAYLPIHAYRMDGKSLVETMIPILDQIQLIFLRLQNAIAKSPGSGLAIDINAIDVVNMGTQKFQGLDLIKLHSHTGHMIYKGATTSGHAVAGIMGGQHFNQKPIEFLEGGYSSDVESAIRGFEMNFGYLAELTGIDRVSGRNGLKLRTQKY